MSHLWEGMSLIKSFRGEMMPQVYWGCRGVPPVRGTVRCFPPTGGPLIHWTDINRSRPGGGRRSGKIEGNISENSRFYPIFQDISSTWTTLPLQLIQKLRNSSQERMPGVAALTRGSPIFPTEIQERVFCLPPRTISIISALS